MLRTDAAQMKIVKRLLLFHERHTVFVEPDAWRDANFTDAKPIFDLVVPDALAQKHHDGVHLLFFHRHHERSNPVSVDGVAVEAFLVQQQVDKQVLIIVKLK